MSLAGRWVERPGGPHVIGLLAMLPTWAAFVATPRLDVRPGDGALVIDAPMLVVVPLGVFLALTLLVAAWLCILAWGRARDLNRRAAALVLTLMLLISVAALHNLAGAIWFGWHARL